MATKSAANNTRSSTFKGQPDHDRSRCRAVHGTSPTANRRDAHLPPDHRAGDTACSVLGHTSGRPRQAMTETSHRRISGDTSCPPPSEAASAPHRGHLGAGTTSGNGAAPSCPIRRRSSPDQRCHHRHRQESSSETCSPASRNRPPSADRNCRPVAPRPPDQSLDASAQCMHVSPHLGRSKPVGMIVEVSPRQTVESLRATAKGAGIRSTPPAGPTRRSQRRTPGPGRPWNKPAGTSDTA